MIISKRRRQSTKCANVTFLWCILVIVGLYYSSETYSSLYDSLNGRKVMASGEAVTIANDAAIGINTNTVIDTDFGPLDCVDFLRQMKAGTHPQQVVDPNNGVQYVNKTVPRFTPHTFYWSVHNQQFDPVRWGSFMQGYYYESRLTQAWTAVLKNEQKDRDSFVLDVGGNIGYYTLLTAAMGYTSHVFEPNNVNLLRMCESVQYNKWQDQKLVKVHPMGISNKKGELPFHNDPTNPGAGSFEKSAWVPALYTLPVTTLDDFVKSQGWFNADTKASIPILKIDVEGHEANVVLGASKLLHSHLVKNIFVELRIAESSRPALELLIDAGYELYKHGAWMGPDTVNKYGSGRDLISTLINNSTLFVKPTELYVNMWWKLPNVAAL